MIVFARYVFLWARKESSGAALVAPPIFFLFIMGLKNVESEFTQPERSGQLHP